MKPVFTHSWNLTPAEAIALQKELAPRVQVQKLVREPRLILGIDCAPSKDYAFYFAAAVLWDRQTRQVLEYHIGKAPLTFPYVPGLLSFREIPAILNACAKTQKQPDVIMVDGHGVCHPRGLGIASHVGLLFGLPALGCGKKILYGRADVPGIEQGSTSSLLAKDKEIGKMVRTRTKVKPVIVSVGHLIDLDNAVKLVLECTAGFRLPEPTRQADKLVDLKQETRDPIIQLAERCVLPVPVPPTRITFRSDSINLPV